MKSLIHSKKLLLAILFSGFAGFAFAIIPPAKTNAVSNSASAKTSKVKDLKLSNIEFDFNSSNIRPSSYQDLDRLAEALKEDKASITISGHADNIGAYVYNWNLSKKRAESVRKYLISKGNKRSKIAATEFGDTKPIASNDTAEGRQKNRRVEFTVY